MNLDIYTKECGLALLQRDYEQVNHLLYLYSRNDEDPQYTQLDRLTNLVRAVMDLYGDSMFLDQATILMCLSSQMNQDIKELIGIYTEYFINNELLSGEVYKGLEPIRDFVLTAKHGLYLSHKALAEVLLKHNDIDLKYQFIPSHQDAKQYIIKSVDRDLPSLLVERVISRYDELTGSEFYDYAHNLRLALMNCTAYDLFLDLPQYIVQYLKTIKVKEDICIVWIEDLIELLTDKTEDGRDIYISHEEEMIAQFYKTVPPLVLNVINQGEVLTHTFNVPITVFYRLGLITFHPIFDLWFKSIENM